MNNLIAMLAGFGLGFLFLAICLGSGLLYFIGGVLFIASLIPRG